MNLSNANRTDFVSIFSLRTYMDFNFESAVLNDNFHWNFDSVYKKPNIPSKKIMGALTYARVEPNEVLVLMDDTVFGGAKDGMVITTKGIFSHEPFSERRFFEWKKIKNVTSNGKELNVNGFPFYKPATINKEIVASIARQLNKIIEIVSEDIVDDNEPAHSQINKDRFEVTSNSNRPNNLNTERVLSSTIHKKNHHLSYIPNDSIYEQMKKIRNIGTAFNVASIFLGGNSKNNPITAVDETVERAIHQAAISFREDIVNNHGITEFANDFATIEAASYTTGMIIKKLNDRGAPDIILKTIFLDSFQKALFIKNTNDRVKGNFTDAMLEYAESDDASMIFFMKLLLSNKKQKLITNINNHIACFYDPITQAPSVELQETIEYIEPKVISAKNKIDRQIEICVRDVLNIIYS